MTRTTPSPTATPDARSGTKRVRAAKAGLPAAQGLYDPRHEHDACGVGFIAHMKGETVSPCSRT